MSQFRSILEKGELNFYRSSSTESAKKADFCPIFPGLVAVLCETDFNSMHHSRLRRQRAFNEKCFSKITKFNSLYSGTFFISNFRSLPQKRPKAIKGYTFNYLYGKVLFFASSPRKIALCSSPEFFSRGCC